MNTDVTEITQIYNECNKIVTDLIQIRKVAGFTQQFMADWLKVSRKKINEFESGNFDFDIMVKYAYNLSVEITITHKVN